MAIEIPSNLTPELVPFAWLLGTWEGTGTMWYEGQENTPFGQIITFEQDGLPFIEYRAESFLLDDEGKKLRPITVETGFWQIDRPLTDADGGFGIVPKDVVPAFADAESVETLRNEDDGFSLLATIAHPGGISENYVGMVKGPVVRMQTGNLLRDEISHEYAGSVRLWGLVNGNLMWDWEIADAEGKLHITVGAQQDEAAAVACLNEVVAGELREFYVEGAAVVGGVSGCLWGGAVGHSSSLNGACGLTLFVSGGAELGWAGAVEGGVCEEIHVYCELKL